MSYLLVSFQTDRPGKTVDLDQTPQNVASDQILHVLLLIKYCLCNKQVVKWNFLSFRTIMVM